MFPTDLAWPDKTSQNNLTNANKFFLINMNGSIETDDQSMSNEYVSLFVYALCILLRCIGYMGCHFKEFSYWKIGIQIEVMFINILMHKSELKASCWHDQWKLDSFIRKCFNFNGMIILEH